MLFGDKLKLLRKENNWTQEDLANKLKTTPQYVSKYERNKVLPTNEFLKKIALTFNVSVDYLLFDDIEKSKLNSSVNRKILSKLQEIDQLSTEDVDVILYILDSINSKNKINKLRNSL